MKHLYIGKDFNSKPSLLDLKIGNRHGLIAGATGTGKTITLQVLAEQFSEAGVPVFATDVKGDLSGIGVPGKLNAGLIKRAKDLGVTPYTPQQYPVHTWDIMGLDGEHLRATVKDMGALLMARLLNLTPTQEGVLTVVYAVSRQEDLPMVTLEDFRESLRYCVQHAQRISIEHGYLTASTLGILLRGATALGEQGGDKFFGAPEFDVNELLVVDESGMGAINLLASESIMESPKVYAAFVMWLMQKLFQTLPEIGDPDRPKLVFFFDEAHLLFKDAPKALLDTVERVVRLIRSKGVGIYFVTQSPSDVPEAVLGQLGNRFQHALRAFTPKDKKAIKSTAETFRENPELDVVTAITNMGKGTALVSTLDASGIPSIVEVVQIRPPRSKIGPAPRPEREVMTTEVPQVSPIADTGPGIGSVRVITYTELMSLLVWMILGSILG